MMFCVVAVSTITTLMPSLYESDETRCCVNAIFPPEDGHVNGRNISRIIV